MISLENKGDGDIQFNSSKNEKTIQASEPTSMLNDITSAILEESRNASKWNILFDKRFSQWMSFKPKENMLVYPCYSCQDIFGRKNSFVDHINRRGMVIEYTCPYCPHNGKITFYNPCSFLLHAREHFTLSQGEIDLNNIDISLLPMGLAGFSESPQLYDVTEDDMGIINYINSKFYAPITNYQGKRLVTMKPYMLLFFNPSHDHLLLKQISANIPCCKFVKLSNHELERDAVSSRLLSQQSKEYNIYKENCDAGKKDNFDAEIPRKYKGFAKCPECHQVQICKMTDHFIGNNRPTNDNLKCSNCKYVATTLCSLKAHERIHSFSKPFVCPECGKNFESQEVFKDHLEELCFHVAKRMRFKCPGSGCRKIFATYFAFSNHFNLHLFTFFKCSMCTFVLDDSSKFLKHLKNAHDLNDIKESDKFFRCMYCSTTVPFSKSIYFDHLHKHCNDSDLKVYVYGCKYCRAFCRSRETYALHLLRCAKSVKNLIKESNLRSSLEPIIDMNQEALICTCEFCFSVFKNSDEYIEHLFKCNGGSNVNCDQIITEINKSSDTIVSPNISTEDIKSQKDAVSCVLCNKEFSSTDIGKHLILNDETTEENANKNVSNIETCKYQKPVVLLNSNIESLSALEENKIETIFTNNKKRKRSFTSRTKHKKNLKESDTLLEPEEPQVFKGTYFCKICDYNDENRIMFQEHISKHRDLSTSYQCMECGECFIVKPSLIKHLNYIHQIFDVKSYFENNKCFEEQEKGTVFDDKIEYPFLDNQCSVCSVQFTSEFEVNNHFKMHGMAFLLVNKK